MVSSTELTLPWNDCKPVKPAMMKVSAMFCAPHSKNTASRECGFPDAVFSSYQVNAGVNLLIVKSSKPLNLVMSIFWNTGFPPGSGREIKYLQKSMTWPIWERINDETNVFGTLLTSSPYFLPPDSLEQGSALGRSPTQKREGTGPRSLAEA